MGVFTKERKGVAAEVLMVTPSLSHVRETMGFTGYSEMFKEGRGQMMRRWVLLKIPRCDIDGVGEGK